MADTIPARGRSPREAEFHANAALQGLTPKIERQRAARAELEQVYDAIWETPAATTVDIAALLDIAIEKGKDRPDVERMCVE